jgi:hypothetical protein
MGKTRIQWAVAVVLIGIAGWRFWVFIGSQSGPAEKAYFYDLSERKLFVAARGLVPPIRGINDPTEDGVRAVVIAPPGRCGDATVRRIAYLETSSPELKQALEAAKASGQPPAIGRGAAQGLRWVRRETDAEWVSLTSEEGERIVSEWAVPGADGQSPSVCTP